MKTPPSVSTPSCPTVSIGVPVYNGANTLSAVLDNLRQQSFKDFEIIISDNASSDQTPDICQAHANKDSRISYFRQPYTIPATHNFNFVLQKSRAPFFMWAAHDDLRNQDFIVTLLKALQANPDSILAFGDIIEYVDGKGSPLFLDFCGADRTPERRLYWAAISQLHHLYGLWRTEILRQIKWRHVDWWHDTPLMMAAAMLGDFTYAPGAEFHYTSNQHPFFDMQRKRGVTGLLDAALWASKRGIDLCRLIWLSALTVNQVAGMRLGMHAGVYAVVKVMQQTKTFVTNRI